LADAPWLLIAEEALRDVLAFLPGAANTARLRESQAIAQGAGLLVLPLYGDCPLAEQEPRDRAGSTTKSHPGSNCGKLVTVEGGNRGF